MNECKRPNSNRGSYYSMDALGQFPIAMAYVPWQRFGQTYDLSKALCAGTMFAELNLPFKGGKCR